MGIGYGHWTLDHPPTIGSLVAIMTNLVIITTMIINMIIVMIIIITINILIIVIIVIIVGDQGPPISSQVTVLTAFPTVGGGELLQMGLDEDWDDDDDVEVVEVVAEVVVVVAEVELVLIVECK